MKSHIVKFIHEEKGRRIDVPYLYIDLITKIFYARKDGRTRSLETDIFKIARAKITDVINELGDEKPLTQNKLFRDYYRGLIDQKISEDIKPQTLKRIENIWSRSIEPYWGDFTPEDITPNMMADFITWHRRKRPGVQLINVYKYLGNIFRFMVRQGDLNPGKVPDLILPKEEKRHHEIQKGTYVTKEEMYKILERTKLPRNKLIYELSYSYGMRLKEICTLRKDQVEPKRRTINLTAFDTKTGYGRIIPLSEDHFSRVQAFFKNNSDYLFPCVGDIKKPIPTQIIDRAFRIAVKTAAIGRRVNFHSLRHTCASNFPKANVTPAVACTILGMSLQIYQKRYLKLGPDDLRLAIEAVSLSQTGGKR